MNFRQPPDQHIGNGAVVGRIEWRSDFAADYNGRYKRAQMFVDSEVLRLSDPYVPFQTGTLRNSGVLGTMVTGCGAGKVVWNIKYARFLYYGKVMVGAESRSVWAKQGEPKVVTECDLTYHGAPKCGAFWFERMKADHGKTIIAGARRIVRGATP